MIDKTISHYKVHEQLGRGGMGVVYKAEDTKLKRTVALKFLSANALGGREERTRFINEARTAAALSHPNICTVYEIDEAEGQTFISMEYVAGRNLRQMIADGPMKLQQAVAIAVQVAEGLQEAHEAGVVHRDIKSANIMLNEKGRPVIMDFGLAKQGGQTAITREGVSLGTIDYMSPEQAQGHDINGRTDIWALGVMLYEMISGRLPFHADKEHAVIYSIINTNPEPLTAIRTGVPMDLERVVTKALAKNPGERYQSAADMLVDLRAVQREIGDASTIGTASYSVGVGPPRQTSFVRRLLERRVPHILGIYIVASIAIVGFMQFLVNRFPISPHLPDFGLIMLAAMIPTVFLLAYYHGGAGGNGRRAVERIGIPTNVVLAGVLLFLLFQDKDLGATTTAVKVADDEGNTVERVIPKSEFRKRVALFYFDNDSNDPALDWLSSGLIHLLRYDLYQDSYLTVNYGFVERHKEAGFAGAVGSPLTLKRDIADDFHYAHLVAGSFTRENDIYRLQSAVYATQDAKRIARYDYQGRDLFALVDSLSLQLRRDIGIPAYHIAESRDLPVSEVFTGNLAALEAYSRCVDAINRNNDYESAREFLLPGLQADATFAVGHWRLAGVYMALNRGEDGLQAIRTALEHKYKLPERIQIQLTGQYYNVKDDQEASFENAKRWVTLYPGEVSGRETLAGHYERTMRIDDAIAERQRVLDIEPQDVAQLQQIGRLYEIKGEFSKARDYFQQYADRFPDKYESFTRIGQLYQTAGDHEQAREYYRKALLIEPEETSIHITLAQIEQSLGNLDGAEQAGLGALANATTPQDSSAALDALTQHYALRGRAVKALDSYERGLIEKEKFYPPVGIVFVEAFSGGMYVLAGRAEEAWQKLETIASAPTMIPQLKPVLSAGYMTAYFATHDPSYVEEARYHLAKFEPFVETSGNENYRWALEWCRAAILHWEEDREAALASMQKALDAVGQEQRQLIVEMNAHAARICRELERYEQGRAYAEQALAIEPFDPWANHEMALIYHEMGNQDKAATHLGRALYVYKGADKHHLLANRVWDTRNEWRSEGLRVQ